MFPDLTTERLRLRDIGAADANDIYRVFSDKRVTRYYGQEPFHDQQQAEKLVQQFQLLLEEERGIRWGIERREDNQFLGTIGFHAYNKTHRRAEIGYELCAESWGNGYMSEAAGTVISYGYEKLLLNRISAVVFLQNQVSASLLKKLGFQEEGILREYMYQGNLPQDAYMFSLLRSGWENK
ncbi:GNAT family N-acetyltransferase [Bacillus lacus]|uniref:GNAT family N-acetyltransferase n=1 Tax=Metabacillus lacus TaxID=1983721 RepID=A0A7X2J291_9BACI|nr:GNAT family N-acetyltransferase [Metabacillus lacus]